MNSRIKLLAEQAGLEWGPGGYADYSDFDHSLFAELIVRECVNTLEFHGFDDAAPYLKWMATNKLGVK